ncbi:MAG: BatA domain-containing protein [Bacteroidales bacterium]
MTFIYPIFLWGLFALLIPILIHLLNFRPYKKVLFSNTIFLHQVKKQTRKQSKVRNILILLCRLLAVFCIVMAFSQPRLKEDSVTKIRESNKDYICLYIDNSLSMEALVGKVSLLEEAKRKAIELVKSFPEGTSFQILTNDLSPMSHLFLARDKALQTVNQIQFSNKFITSTNILKRQQDLLKGKEGKKLLFWISDFQKSVLQKVQKNEFSFADKLYLIPLKRDVTKNIAIDSVELQSLIVRPGEMVQLKLRFANYSDTDLEKIAVNLKVNGKLKALSNIDLPAKKRKWIQMEYELKDAQDQLAYIEIEDFPIRFDNKFYFVLPVKSNFQIAEIYSKESSIAFRNLFEKDSLFNFKSLKVGQFDYQKLNDKDFVLVNGLSYIPQGLQKVLDKNLSQGKTVLILPPESFEEKQLSKNSYLFPFGRVLEHKGNMVKMSFDNPLFKGVFEKVPDNFNAPVVKKYFEVTPKASNLFKFKKIFSIENGDPILLESNIKGGHLFYSLSPIKENWNSLSNHAFFVPVFLQMAMLKQLTNPIYLTLGKETKLQYFIAQALESKESMAKINSGSVNVIPQQRLKGKELNVFTQGNDLKQGFASLNFDKIKIANLAFNVDRLESDLEVDAPENIKNKYFKGELNVFVLDSFTQKNLSDFGSEQLKESTLWKIFLVLAILFIIIEAVLLRLKRPVFK